MNLEEPNCFELVKFLLDKGANPNLGDVEKVTPLHLLAATKYFEDGQPDVKTKLVAQKAFEQELNNNLKIHKKSHKRADNYRITTDATNLVYEQSNKL